MDGMDESEIQAYFYYYFWFVMATVLNCMDGRTSQRFRAQAQI